MKKINILLCSLLLLGLSVSCIGKQSVSLKVLQLNLWYQGGIVPDGVGGIIDIIDQTNPDIIFLCEIRKEKNNPFIEDLKDELKKRGKAYDGKYIDQTMGILSKYRLTNVISPFTLEDDSRPVCKATLTINGQNLTVYSVHWDYTHYECYMPREYSGTTWKKIDAPADNTDSVLTANRLSYREEGVAALLKDAQQEIKQGNIVILGGDFNEPSHLDWQADTKDMRNHNGLVINWDCSAMLHNAGYKDAYRELYPNPVTHPGFSWPAGNKAAPMDKLMWVADADDRDRIDFIYYYPNKDLTLKDVAIVGPIEDLCMGEIKDHQTQDPFIIPKGVWPSDHKGTLATFTLCTE
ncbi:endonuclease/exonuclease/phosphatase family protein [uncultured Parabacteroides sp.]|uniref:endonuclease/exonuclease/phosphatase family protein n=1 Tax=uncultured Parabacteroides sp. TaxID=512312 RepID=UPI0025D711B4|nr:endonuclease/exonuclease/phosphatase family protein [uncultured Parabacteroides sp.]